MRKHIRFLAFAVLLTVCSISLAAQDRGYWRASTSTARLITGDIAISNTKLTINFLSFPVVQARLHALGYDAVPQGAPYQGRTLFRVRPLAPSR